MRRIKFLGIHFMHRSSIVLFLLVVTILCWTLGPLGWFGIVRAASLTNVSDTLSTSAPSSAAVHTISFKTPTGIAAGQTITITFDNNFGSVATIVAADVTWSGKTLAATCSGTTWGLASAGQVVTLTSCTDTVAANATITLTIGNSHKITNPAATGSYKITIAGTMVDSGTAMVAIVNQVTMTASVDTSFTFTVSGVASGQANANGDANNGGNTNVTTTSTTIPWGTLVAGTAKTARQDLTVATNATNGFAVTLQQNQDMTSSTGSSIHAFKDGAYTAAPTAWTAPANTLGNPSTYGHYGITSEDSDLNSDEFGTALYAGNINTPRTIFSNSGPADGTSANIGATKIGFKIQISALQQAGNDYTNTLTYIATPTF